MDEWTYGREAFEAYRASRKGRNHDGTPTPEWDELGNEIKVAWEIGAAAAINEYRRDEKAARRAGSIE